jgi:peptidoglycan pentaglycine glycine transferase (the first glycine)
MSNNSAPLIARAVTDEAWDAFVAQHATPHILQTGGWAALKARFGWEAERVALVDRAGAIQAGAEVLYRRVAGLTLAYVPRGPLTDWADPIMTGRLLGEIEARSRARGAAVLKLEPELFDTPANRALLADYGFRPGVQTVQPPSTILLDLRPDDDAILQAMKSKWRYNVRLAERKGVTVRALAADELATFNELMAATGERDGFAIHGPDYYAAAYDLLVRKHGVFLLAEYQGAPLASIAVFAVGSVAWYLWGASNNRERNRMPNHALQWAGMQWAKAQDAATYDLWGIPDEIGGLAHALAENGAPGVAADRLPVDLNRLPEHGLWGVYRFKQGFGGEVVRYVGAWDKALQTAGFRAYQLGLALREQPARMRQLDPVSVTLSAVSRRSPARTTTLRAVERPEQWRAVLADLPEPHVLQSWEWGEIKGAAGWQAERLLLPGAKGAPEAAVQFLWRQPVDRAPLRVAYVPKGPVLDWTDPGLVERALKQIEAHAHARNCLFVKIDPDVREDTTAGRSVVHALFRRGWRYSPDQIQFKNTAYSDLTLDEGDLLAGMKSKWRYNIRLAGRRGITVRLGGPADLPAFYDLYAETGARDGFLIRPFGYYRTTWETFLHAEEDEANPAGGALLLAEHEEEDAPVAGLFLLRNGARSWYFYGASSERRRRDMPNYLLQWEALRWSRSRGCTVYDWWGAPTDLDDPDDGLQGVWQFKQGFGAEFQPHVGAWDYAVSPVLYQAYTQAMPAMLEMMRRRG